MTYIVGVDIGGTFTDCVALSVGGAEAGRSRVDIGKAPSTPPDFQTGFIESIRAAAGRLGIDFADFILDIQEIYHGCTVGTNALVEHRTANVGLLVTRGHRDTIFAMQGGGRLKRLPAEYVAHVASQTKPEPLVPKWMCGEIDERVTRDGEVLVELNEEQARSEIRRLLAQGAEAFAVSLLWSTANDKHELRLAELVAEEAPGAFVSVGSAVVSRTGEYERTIAAIVNALIGPAMNDYLEALEKELAALGYKAPVQIMTCSGGLVDSAYAREFPILTIGSGPVAGLIGSGSLASQSDSAPKILTADMGGTTFDVGVINDGQPLRRPTSSYGQYEYYVPTLDVRSIGAGGGSIVRYDPDTQTLKVGPQSAGARPGPACYGRGGQKATIADSDVVLGYLNPSYFLGGAMTLDVEAARRVLGEAGAPLGFGPEETAAAAARIVDNAMADAIRLASVQQGYDPRQFWMYAFGGAGPVHATALASELGLRGVIVPLNDFASGWSAFGVASADAVVVKEAAVAMNAPFATDELQTLWSRLEAAVMQELTREGIDPSDITLDRSVDMRYATQINQIEVSVESTPTFGEAESRAMIDTFERDYERLFGVGSGYAKAGFALTGLRVRGVAAKADTSLSKPGSSGADPVVKGHRDVIYYEQGIAPISTPVYDGGSVGEGHEINGPAIIEYPGTTVVLRPGNRATVDDIGNVRIEL